MQFPVKVSTPSRICLFGEHQDYLGLEVIALAIDLRFSAKVTPRSDKRVVIRIRDEKLGALNVTNDQGLYEEYVVDMEKPIIYENHRDYMKSCVNLLMKKGILVDKGFDVVMDSTIPIGKGMCSSTTMIMALLRGLIEGAGSDFAQDLNALSELGFDAEVAEFGEPGGKMDHYTSALGGLVHLDFRQGCAAHRLPVTPAGRFILFDSLRDKDTIRVLSQAKAPVVSALQELKAQGIGSIRDFYEDPSKLSLIQGLDDTRKKKLLASCDNYAILREALWMLSARPFDPVRFGELIYAHHENLRDGLEISTPEIEDILDTAMAYGALGGKVNGSGGGGCCYAYCRTEDAQRILEAVEAKGYPGHILKGDVGNYVEGI